MKEQTKLQDIKLSLYVKREVSEPLDTKSLNQIYWKIKKAKVKEDKNDRIGVVYPTYSSTERSKAKVESFTGLMFIDIDKVEAKDSKAVKALVINGKSTVMAYHSSRGVCTHCIIRIPICKDADEYARRFKNFCKVINPILPSGEVDETGVNSVQIAFLPVDEDAYFDRDASIFEGIEPKEVAVERTVTPRVDYDGNVVSEKKVLYNLNKFMNGLVGDGFENVRKISFRMGGWVAGGEIDSSVVLNALTDAISANAYLNSKQSSKSIKGYLKVMTDSFKAGQNRPLRLTNYGDTRPKKEVVRQKPMVISNAYEDKIEMEDLLSGKY